MVEVLGLVSMISRYPEAVKLIRVMLAGNIGEIKPTIDLATKLGFAYPQVESLLGIATKEVIVILEFLADKDILERYSHDELLFCPRCQSPNLKYGLGCPKCGSGNIANGRILEHFACRNNSFEDEYVNGAKYVCPKCKQELKYLGTDYQSLGINYKCYDCGMVSKEAIFNWQCLQCSLFIPEGETKQATLNSYRLNGAKRRWLEFELDEKGQFIRFLRSQGYEVTENAKVNGTSKSGAEHVLDIIARRDDGLIAYFIGIGILIGSLGQEVGLGQVFAFDQKVYDLGIHDKILLVVPKLSSEARQFARQQRIEVIEEKDLKAILASETTPTLRQPYHKPINFETKAKLLEHLKNSGYTIEEKARIRGRSGVEHSFDILAYNDDGIITHTLGLNIIITKDEVSFDAVSSFDTRAYDVGIHDKLLLVSPRLSREAKQFAQYQRIKVIQVDEPAKLT